MFTFRISELSSRMLKSGNADVTELSDPNRPMKLCEELNMVYDNEWTDCYEALTEDKDKKDDEAIDILYGMLQVETAIMLKFVVTCFTDKRMNVTCFDDKLFYIYLNRYSFRNTNIVVLLPTTMSFDVNAMLFLCAFQKIHELCQEAAAKQYNQLEDVATTPTLLLPVSNCI